MRKIDFHDNLKDDKKPKHIAFRELLLKNIVEKKVWTPGEKIPPEREMQKSYGISRNTIRIAIKNLVDEGYLFREIGRGTFVNSKSAWGRIKKLSKSKLIGLIITDVKYDFSKKLVKGAEDLMHEKGYSLVLCQDNLDIAKTYKYIRMLIDSDVKGVILDPVLTEDFINDNKNIIDILESNGIPVVLVDRDIPTLKKSLIFTNNEEITFKAANYLIQNKHKDILVIKQNCLMMDIRLEGIVNAYKENNIPISHLHEINIKPSNNLLQDIQELVNEVSYILNFTSAAISLSEYLGRVTYRAFAKLKKRIPTDISFITFDHPEDSSFEEGKITFIEQPAVKMGKMAAKTIIDLIENGSDTIYSIELKSKLIIRNSVIPNKKDIDKRIK